MSALFLHTPQRIVAELLWRNRAIGTDPSWWESHRVADRADATHDWPVRYGLEGSEPDEAITVYGATPVNQAKVLLTGEQVRNHGLTVRVRARDDDTAGAMALRIEHDFHEAAHDQTITIGSAQYLVQSFPRADVTPPFGAAPGSKLRVVNVNCLAVILAYPIRG